MITLSRSAIFALLIFITGISPVGAQTTRELFSRPGLSVGAYHYNVFDGIFNASYRYAGDTILCGDTLLVYETLPSTNYKIGLKVEGAKVRAVYFTTPCQYGPYYYDFDLQVGNVFDASLQGEGYYTVVETGEKLLLNGEYRRYLRLNNNPNFAWTVEWIEGIGDVTRGLLPAYDFEGYGQFVCARDSSGTLWEGPVPPVAQDCDSLLCPNTSVSFSWSIVDKACQFTGQLRNADEWWWDFGDGQSSVEINPTHVYEFPGCYEVRLSARANCSHQTSSYVQAIPVCINADWDLVNAPTFPHNDIVWDLVFPTPDTGWARTQNQVFKTVDGGLSWTAQSLPPSEPGSTRHLNGLYMANAQLGIIPCGYYNVQSADANFLITTDGEHWLPSNVGQKEWMTGACLTPNGRGYGVATYGGFYRTQDFGQTWETVPPSTNLGGFLYPQKIVPLQGDTVYILGSIELFSNLHYSTPLMFRTYDRGDHWEAVFVPDPPGTYVYRDMFFFDGHNGWLPGKGGVLLHTLDGGNTWEEVPFGSLANVNTIDFFDAQNGWAAGGGMILHTKNGGQSWERENCGYTGFVAAIDATTANTAMAASHLYQLLKYAPSATPLCEASGADEIPSPAEVSAWTIFPNPSYDYLEVDRKSVAGATPFQLIIINELGQVLQDRIFSETPARLDVAALKPGVYSLLLTDGANTCHIRRFVVCR